MNSQLNRFSRSKTAFVVLAILASLTGLISFIGKQWTLAMALSIVAFVSFLLAKVASKIKFPGN